MIKPSGAAVFLLGFLVAACASSPSPTAIVTVPDKLKPAAGESLATIVPAKGVQIYECRAKRDQAEAGERPAMNST